MSSNVPVVSIAIRFVLGFAVMALALFSSAGTLVWPEAWFYITMQMAASGVIACWLAKHDPALLETRMSLFRPTAKGWDRVFMLIVILLFIPFLLLPGLDAVRYQWSSVPLLAEFAGFAAVGWSLWLIFRVLQENSFASPAVEIQKERGHRVIDTGPYAYVRHPMYSAFIVLLFALPMALGSLRTLALSLLLAGCFIIRILPEERMLCSELAGYPEYAGRVRYRLLPGIW